GVQALVGIREVHPRSGVGGALRQPHLPGQEELAATKDAGPAAARALRQPLGEVDVVTAPAGVHRPDLAVPEPETRCPGDEEQGRVVAGPAAPRLPHDRALVERPALRAPLTAPAT